MRSSRVVLGASDCQMPKSEQSYVQYQHPTTHSGIWEAADEAVLNKAQKKFLKKFWKNPPKVPTLRCYFNSETLCLVPEAVSGTQYGDQTARGRRRRIKRGRRPPFQLFHHAVVSRTAGCFPRISIFQAARKLSILKELRPQVGLYVQ